MINKYFDDLNFEASLEVGKVSLKSTDVNMIHNSVYLNNMSRNIQATVRLKLPKRVVDADKSFASPVLFAF